ncbi:MAG: YdcF family protein, partial [Chlorobi bacterium]|nr:YdcF family protein [Chlorobiota bacterium]
MKYAPYDAIIVPGVPFDGKEWSDIMKMRVYWSYLLYKRGVAEHIIYSGGAVYSPYYESEIMKLYAIKLGIPDSVIFTDTVAEHSTENLWYSFKLAKQKGFKKLALATDPVQNFMTR